jgi:HemY protein
MTEAEFALDDRRFEDARIALNQFAAREGRHIAALRLSLRAEQGLGNWREVARLVRQLEKHQALTAEQAAPIRARALREALRGLRDDATGLMRYWRELDEADRAHPALALETARALMAAGDCREAQRVIEDALEENWDASLLLAYGDCGKPGEAAGDVLGRIARAEKWLQRMPRDGELLLTLGRLCRQQQLWGKARSYLEAALAVAPSRAAHVELAQLLEQLEESALAARHYRSAACSSHGAPSPGSGRVHPHRCDAFGAEPVGQRIAGASAPAANALPGGTACIRPARATTRSRRCACTW